MASATPPLQFKGRLDPAGEVHWVECDSRVPADGEERAANIRTLCGVVPQVVYEVEDAEISCGACIEFEGGPAVEWAEQFLIDVRTAEPATASWTGSWL